MANQPINQYSSSRWVDFDHLTSSLKQDIETNKVTVLGTSWGQPEKANTKCCEALHDTGL